MHRLLIVDNEKLIVDNLVDLFVKAESLRLEVFGAYTAAGALELMSRTKIDIVLSDIRMPGMDGLELQQEINRQWPGCKIIFLSGYDDFEYVQRAMRHGSIDYLLKTEGERKVVETVGSAIRQLEEVWGKERLIEQAKRHMQEVRPLLRKEYLWSLLQGEAPALRHLADKFAELAVPLSPHAPALLAIARVDDWRDDYGFADRELLLYAVRNIADECWGAGAAIASVAYDRNRVAWLMQPPGAPSGPQDAAAWIRLVRFAHGTAETVQKTCGELLGLKLSLAMASEPREWRRATEQFDTLKRLLSFGAGLGRESLLLDKGRSERQLPRGYDHEIRAALKQLPTLGACLENGQKRQFFEEFGRLVSLGEADDEAVRSLRLEIALSLAAMLLSFMNRWGLHGDASDRFDPRLFTRFDREGGWTETVERFAALAEWLFEWKRSGQEFQENGIVGHVQWYVRHHLSGDLSLVRIGEVVGHNPYYLSRLYKEITGENLSDFIAAERLRKAKELLAGQTLRIGDISQMVGFSSDHSFYRFFKKAEGLTPQEFRERSAGRD